MQEHSRLLRRVGTENQGLGGAPASQVRPHHQPVPVGLLGSLHSRLDYYHERRVFFSAVSPSQQPKIPTPNFYCRPPLVPRQPCFSPRPLFLSENSSLCRARAAPPPLLARPLEPGARARGERACPLFSTAAKKQLVSTSRRPTPPSPHPGKCATARRRPLLFFPSDTFRKTTTQPSIHPPPSPPAS
jgi:hypothetical protein